MPHAIVVQKRNHVTFNPYVEQLSLPNNGKEANGTFSSMAMAMAEMLLTLAHRQKKPGMKKLRLTSNLIHIMKMLNGPLQMELYLQKLTLIRRQTHSKTYINYVSVGNALLTLLK